MRVSLLILLFLCSCQSNAELARIKAIKQLPQYDLSEITERPKITIYDSVDIVSEIYYMETGIDKKVPGFYNSKDREIVIWKNAPFVVWKHEYAHFMLSEYGIPLHLHHKIINQ